MGLFRAFVVIWAATLAGVSVGADRWRTPGLLAESVCNPGNLTEAKWIWHEGPVRRLGECFYRFEFALAEPVTSLVFHVAMDDSGEWYLNGRRLQDEKNAADNLKVGQNVFAAHVKNYERAGGLLVFGEGLTADGAKIEIRSGRSFKASGTGDGDWTAVDYDDASWRSARVLADASGQPFSNDRDYLPEFATAGERQAVAAYRAAHVLPLPTGLADEPEPLARIVYDGNLPKISVNGFLHEPNLDANGVGDDFARNILVKSADLGFRFHQLGIGPAAFERAPGVYDFSRLDEMACQALSLAPNAYLFLVFDISIPKWCKAHPEALVGYADGKVGEGGGDELSGRVLRPSAASPEYRIEVERLISALGAYVKSRPWGKRVVALRPCWGIYWEWHVYGMYHSPDVGPAMTAAFRRWKGGCYANEIPPTGAERTHGGVLMDPVRDRKVLDFYDCLQNEVADLLLLTARAIKRALPGRLVGAYYGYVFTTHSPEGSNVMLDKVLSSPDVDFLSDPTVYTPGSRRAGGAYYHRTIPATFHRYGKLVMIEDDMRFHHVLPFLKGEWAERYCAATPRESQMTMRRDYLNRLFDGCGIQIFDPGGLSGTGTRLCAHDDPDVLRGLHEAMEVSRRAGHVSADSGNDTALVADWRECLRQDNKAHRNEAFRLLYDRGLEFAYRSGVTFDVLSADDYLASKKRYAHVVFMNLFNPEEPMASDVAERLRKTGARAVRLVLPGARPGALGASVRELSEPPADENAWADLLVSLGAHRLASPGSYVRRQGDLVLFHTAARGLHQLSLPTEFRETGVTELFSGRAFEGADVQLSTEGPDTLLFKARRPEWSVRGFLPDVERPKGSLSAARWLWHAGPVETGGTVFLRKTFDLPDDVVRAGAQLAFDDGCECFVNGVKLESTAKFSSALRPGRNVLAAKVRNAVGPGGFLFFADVALKNGKTVAIRSDRSFVAASKASEDWMLPDYDDSHWTPAREQGDVTMRPFSHYRDYTWGFATEGERRAIQNLSHAFDGMLPSTLPQEPEPVAKVVYRGFRPQVFVNGETFEPIVNLSAAGSDYAWNQAIKMSTLGVRLHQVAIRPKELGKGSFDFSSLDRSVREVLRFVPSAYVGVSLQLDFPDWLARHPEAQVGYADGAVGTGGGDELSGRLSRPSPASPEYRRKVEDCIAALGAYVRAQPWGKRIVFVRPCWGVYSEWHMYGMYHSPDVGPAMTAAFRKWKGGKYAGENPPAAEERTHGGALLDPAKDAKAIDFFACLQKTVADFLLLAARACREAFPGRLVGMYYGYVMTTHPPEGANVMLEDVLSSPDVDFLSDPSIYTPGSRRAGGSYYHRTIPATFRRYGKLVLIEDDMRFHHCREWTRGYEREYGTETPQESRATARRNLLNCLFDGGGIQFCDPFLGAGSRLAAHDDPDVMAGLQEALGELAGIGPLPICSGNDTALVADWRQCLKMDNRAYKQPEVRAICDRALEYAYRSGAAFDFVSVDDLLADPSRYRRLVFLNVFTPSAALARRLAEISAGKKAVRLTVPGASQAPFGPAVRDLTAPGDEREWADLFASLGTHRYAEPGVYIRRHGNLLLFHTAGGKSVLRIPEEGNGVVLREVAFDGPKTLLLDILSLTRQEKGE